MPRHIETITPENVRIEHELAGVASRCGAAVVDLLIQALAIAAVVVMVLGIEHAFKLPVVGMPTAALIVTTFVLWWGYYLFFETIWNGQTPGKRLMRMRVVKYGGTPIDLVSAAIRGLIRVVDMAVIGFVAMFFTQNNQRLGDLAAGTIVVKERAEWSGDIAQPKFSAQSETPESALVKNIELVTPEQFDAIKRFVSRSDELTPAMREQIAEKIARPIMIHMGIEVAGEVIYSSLIAAIYKKCVSERGML